MKRYKLCILIIGFVMLCAPCAAGWYMKGRQFRAVDENRTLAEWPEGSILQAVTSDGSYCSEIADYFNDRFGFRDLFIRMKNQIDYTVFQITPGLYVGEDGYLSYESIVAKVQISNEQLTDEDIEDMVLSFDGVVEYLDQKGIGFYLVLAPQKNEVFPERTLSFPVQRPDPNAYQRLCSALMEDAVMSGRFVDCVTILRQAEESYPTYYKTDFHWNGYGATAVYTQIVNQIAAEDGLEESVFGEEDYTVTYQDGFYGSQLSNFPLLFGWESEAAVYATKNSDITQTYALTGEEPNSAQGHYVNSDENAPLGRVLLIGDSYTWYLIAANSGLLDCFQEVYWVHIGTMEYALTNYANLVDYVILEQVESGPESSILSLKDHIDTLYTN